MSVHLTVKPIPHSPGNEYSRPLCFQVFSVVKLIYLVVKLIYTGLVKYVIITYTNNVRLCQVADGGKNNSTHAESLKFATHWPRHKRNAI